MLGGRAPSADGNAPVAVGIRHCVLNLFMYCVHVYVYIMHIQALHVLTTNMCLHVHACTYVHVSGTCMYSSLLCTHGCKLVLQVPVVLFEAVPNAFTQCF